MRKLVLSYLLSILAIAVSAQQKPNILVIWGDDIGTWNISHNNRGMMGYRTPNIDRIAKEGLAFTDYYAQQSCTAGRAAFLGGNVPLPSGPVANVAGTVHPDTLFCSSVPSSGRLLLR